MDTNILILDTPHQSNTSDISIKVIHKMQAMQSKSKQLICTEWTGKKKKHFLDCNFSRL